MKKLHLIIALCAILLLSCSMKEDVYEENKNLVNLPSDESPENIQESDRNPISSVVTEEGKEGLGLTQDDINFICDELLGDVFASSCKDGSQIISFFIDEDIYIKYMPIKLSDGSYSFFKEFNPSNNIYHHKEGYVEIPVCINSSEDYGFVLKVEYTLSDGEISINNGTFDFANDEDRNFNDMYKSLDYRAQEDYRLSLTPNKNASDLESFLRACVYNGNMAVLDEIYKLTQSYDVEDIHKLELAGSMAYESSMIISENNPYKSRIFYGEGFREFPHKETIEIVAKSMQERKSLIELGAQELEPNYDWESVYNIANFHDFYNYYYENSNIYEVFRLDLDKDGLLEVLFFSPGGTMGNEFWDILHLDGSGLITDTISGDGMSKMTLYSYGEDYFFVSPLIDFNDKEIQGWNVYTFNNDDKIYKANVYFDKIGSEIIFSDNSQVDNYYWDWELDNYVDRYKSYGYEAIGNEIKPSNELIDLLDKSRVPLGVYGSIDFNNDKIDDWTNAYYFYPSNRLHYYCNYYFIDGKTKEIIDFSDYFGEINYGLCRVIPYRLDDKNCFICVLNGDGNYIFKLIEIDGLRPVELQNWLVSVEYQIFVSVSEYIEQ